MANLGTAAEIITEIQGHYRSIDSTTVASYLIIGINRLCYDLPIMTGRYSLKLTAETFEYPLGSGSPWYAWGSSTTATTATAVRIESAYYVESSTSWVKLFPTSSQELDIDNPNWRYESSSNPTKIYTQNDTSGALSVCLYKIPDTTSTPATGAGYPRVDFVMWNSFASTFSGTVTVPSSIRDPLILVYATMSAIHARENNGEGMEWEQKYLRAKSILSYDFNHRIKGNRPNIVNTINTPRTV